MAHLVASLAILIGTTLIVMDAAPPNSPACPQDFVAKFKNASISCEQESPDALLESATTKTVFVGLRRLRRTGQTGPILTSANTSTPSTKKDSASSEEEGDPEVMLCTFAKLKSEIPQLDIVEKSCSTVNPPTGGDNKAGPTASASTTTSKPKDDLDEDLQMASCLEEKLEAMCPELSSVA